MFAKIAMFAGIQICRIEDYTLSHSNNGAAKHAREQTYKR